MFLASAEMRGLMNGMVRAREATCARFSRLPLPDWVFLYFSARVWSKFKPSAANSDVRSVPFSFASLFFFFFNFRTSRDLAVTLTNTL